MPMKPNEKNYKYSYSSILRLGLDALLDERELPAISELLEKYKGAFDEVIFFNASVHAARALEEHRECAARMERGLRLAEKLGVRTGIDFFGTLGFFADNLDPRMSAYTPHMNMNGKARMGKICASVPENVEYIKEHYRIFAALKPQLIYIDDDVCEIGCFCPACVRRFGELYGVFGESEATRENLLTLFSSSDMSVRRRAREAWIDYNSFRISELLGEIEKVVHEVSPETEFGYMTYMSGTDGIDSDAWAAKLRGRNGMTLSWRPGGGVYNEFTPNEVLDKANRIGAQIRFLPPYVTRIESEIENFPLQMLKKSPAFTAFESLTYLAAGCTGTSFSICLSKQPGYAEYEKYFKMAQNLSDAGNLIVDTFGKSAPRGVGFWWDKKTAAALDMDSWKLGAQVPHALDITQIGLPTAYDSDCLSVCFINKMTALQMPDDTLRSVLSKGVLMDAEALDVINGRGYGAYTGFKTVCGYALDTQERELEHRFTMAGYYRYVPQSFGYCGTIYTIEATAAGAEYMTEAVDYEGRAHGMCSGIYENPYGGRIAVGGMIPFHWCFSLPRSVHMKKLMRWLSRDTLPAYLRTFHRMAIWARDGGAIISNISMEDAEDAEVALLRGGGSVEIYIFKGDKRVCAQTLTPDSRDGSYSVYKLPVIPVTGTALIKYIK